MIVLDGFMVHTRLILVLELLQTQLSYMQATPCCRRASSAFPRLFMIDVSDMWLMMLDRLHEIRLVIGGRVASLKERVAESGRRLLDHLHYPTIG